MNYEKLNNPGSGTKPLTPDPNSNRSKRRKNRKFVDLQTSSRKHRRAAKRLLNPEKGGALKYHV